MASNTLMAKENGSLAFQRKYLGKYVLGFHIQESGTEIIRWSELSRKKLNYNALVKMKKSILYFE